MLLDDSEDPIKILEAEQPCVILRPYDAYYEQIIVQLLLKLFLLLSILPVLIPLDVGHVI